MKLPDFDLCLFIWHPRMTYSKLSVHQLSTHAHTPLQIGNITCIQRRLGHTFSCIATRRRRHLGYELASLKVRINHKPRFAKICNISYLCQVKTSAVKKVHRLWQIQNSWRRSEWSRCCRTAGPEAFFGEFNSCLAHSQQKIWLTHLFVLLSTNTRYVQHLLLLCNRDRC